MEMVKKLKKKQNLKAKTEAETKKRKSRQYLK